MEEFGQGPICKNCFFPPLPCSDRQVALAPHQHRAAPSPFPLPPPARGQAPQATLLPHSLLCPLPFFFFSPSSRATPWPPPRLTTAPRRSSPRRAPPCGAKAPPCRPTRLRRRNRGGRPCIAAAARICLRHRRISAVGFRRRHRPSAVIDPANGFVVSFGPRCPSSPPPLALHRRSLAVPCA